MAREYPDPGAYLSLYTAVGEPWLWWERRAQPAAVLAARLAAPETEIYVLRQHQGPVGFAELAVSSGRSLEIAYFGLVPAVLGQGLGGWLMASVLARAWRPGTHRLWLHTCDLDHPGALGFYQRWGFKPFRSQRRVVKDPRLTGILPREAAPHVPLARL